MANVNNKSKSKTIPSKNSNVIKKNVKTSANDNLKKQNKSNSTVNKSNLNNKKTVTTDTIKIKEKSNSKNIVKSIDPINNSSILTQEELRARRKEKNRKKYENQQKKYHESKNIKPKKKLLSEVTENDSDKVQEENLIKKETTDKKDKLKERKEKRKTNRKTAGFTQTIINIKDISVSKINDVRQIADDNNIPVGKTIDERVKRSKRLIKEAIVYTVILTIIDIICILIFDNMNFLRLFDIKALNVIVTILIAIIFNFFVSFMIDYLVTNIWIKRKQRMKDGDSDGNKGFIKRKRKKDIKN